MKPSPTKKRSVSVKSGDIFALGSHLLLCGDCTDADLVRQFVGKTKVDLILTDPPYGVAYVEGKQRFNQSSNAHLAIINDHAQDDEGYRTFTRLWLEAVKLHLATKNSCYIFNADKMIFALREGMVDAGYRFSQLLIWAKTAAIVGRMDYLPQHELIAFGWFGRHAFNKAKDKSVLIHPRPKSNTLHPTMKPINLLRRLILNSSVVGQTVYDPFGGSGSTLLACEQTKRRCLMIEIDPAYCQVIIHRYENLTGEKAKKHSPKEPCLKRRQSRNGRSRKRNFFWSN